MSEKPFYDPANEDALSEGLYALTEAISFTGTEISGGLLGGTYGYGANYENDTFMMHPFCWCEREDCPWCGEIGAMPQLLRDVLGAKYAESERAPNFLFKPTGFKVWWYKYIGRDQETQGTMPNDWYEQCVRSLAGGVE
jgi:hypothetical protein